MIEQDKNGDEIIGELYMECFPISIYPNDLSILIEMAEQSQEDRIRELEQLCLDKDKIIVKLVEENKMLKDQQFGHLKCLNENY